jgi:hypothetical protein
MLFNDPAILVRVCLGYKRSVHLRQSFLAPSAKEKGDANVRIQELVGRVYHQPIVCIYIYNTYIIHLYITAMNIVYIYIMLSVCVHKAFFWAGDFVLPAVMLKMIR